MKTKIMATIAIAAIALASCDKGNESKSEMPAQIRLTTNVEKMSRAAFPEMDVQIPLDRQVAVYVYDATSDAALYENNVLTSNGTGGFTGGLPMYFPATGNGVDIFSFHTNATLSSTGFPATIQHTVAANQVAQADYLSSDLLYSARADIARTTDPVAINYYHMLSKVQVAIRSGNGAPDLTGATVTIVNTRHIVDFVPDRAADVTSLPARTAMLTVPTAGNDVAPITIGADVTTGTDFTAPAYNDAIIVPQTLAANTQFISIQLATGGTLTYTLPAEMVFESGRKYIYHLTVNLTTLLLEGITVTNWDSAVPVEGNAVM